MCALGQNQRWKRFLWQHHQLFYSKCIRKSLCVVKCRVITKGCFAEFKLCRRTMTIRWSAAIAKQGTFSSYNNTICMSHTVTNAAGEKDGMVLPQVLISPLGRRTKVETEADICGKYLHSVVGSKLTPARGTMRLKQEGVMELLPPLAATRPTHLNHSSPLKISPFLLYNPPFNLFSLQDSPASSSNLTDPGKHFSYLTSHSTNPFSQFVVNSCLFPLSTFSSSSTSFSSLTCSQHTPQRYKKGGQLLHNMGSHFVAPSI